MERKPPQYLIAGTMFIVDVRCAELRETEHPENTISFHQMEDHHTHYTFHYDLQLKNLALATSDTAQVIEINIPPMKHLDPVAVAAKYGLEIDQIRQMRDIDLIVDPLVLQRRLDGELPVLSIGEDLFLIEVNTEQLRSKSEPDKIINLRQLNADGHRECKYWGFYHPEEKKLVTIDPITITELPAGVLLIEIPMMEKLDPVGLARRQGLDELILVRKFGYVPQCSATLTPLSLTSLVDFVKYNQQKPRNPLHKSRRLSHK